MTKSVIILDNASNAGINSFSANKVTHNHVVKKETVAVLKKILLTLLASVVLIGSPLPILASEQKQNVLGYFNVKTAEEIREKAPLYPKMAQEYAKLTASEFFASPAGKNLSIAQKRKAEALLIAVAENVSALFTKEGIVLDESDPLISSSALAQHKGYVAGVLSREFGIGQVQVLKALDLYYDSKGDIGILKFRLGITDEYLKKNGWMFNGALNEKGTWEFWGFGKTDIALNLPGVFAGKAAIDFAQIIADGRERPLMERMLSRDPAEMKKLLEGVGSADEVALAAFSARAAQLGWLVSKIGQGIVEAHNPKKESSAIKRWAPMNSLITNFDRMAKERGWGETAKDIDQIRSYYRYINKFLSNLGV